MNCKTQKPEFRMIECSISNLGKVVTGKTPSTKNSLFWEGDIPFITPKDIQKTKHIFDTERNLTFEGMKSVKNCVLPENAICVSCIGNIGYVAKTTSPAVTNQQINSIIVNDANNSDYVYYLMRSLWQRFKNYEGQSTTLSILNKRQFSEIKILIHEDKAVQTKIANVLSSLDNKIELNEKINQNLDWEDYFSICRKIIELEEENQNLEAQAQAIFKSWFVDFEPFGGKMPADWNIAELRAVCKTITKGTTPTTLKKAFVDKGVNFIKAESILSNHTIDLSKIMFIDDETNELLSRSQIKPFDILYTIAGTIGRFSMVMPTQIPANTNQAVAIIRCIDEYKFFIYNMFLCGCHTKYLTTKVVQAVQANLSLAAIGSLPIIQPSQDTLEKYLKLITPIFSAIFKNNEESRRLSQLRDTLLPKLMSGEIDVSEVAV